MNTYNSVMSDNTLEMHAEGIDSCDECYDHSIQFVAMGSALWL